MNLGIPDISALDWSTRAALEDLAIQITAGWQQQHAGDGTHGDITATSINVGSGAIATTGPLTFGGPWKLAIGAVLTPDQITATQNDYHPVGLDTATVLRLSTDASRTLTGIYVADLTSPRWLYLHNIGNNDLVLQHNDTGSTASYRIACPQSANLTLKTGEGVWLFYDKNSANWRVAAQRQGMRINSIQRGTISFTNGGTNTPTATITSVTTATSECKNTGWTVFPADVTLTNATTVTATRDNGNNGQAGVVAYEVVEWI